MSRPPDEAIPALYRYQAVKYSHVDVEPGCTQVLTADPWSYLYAFLSQRIPNSRGDNRARLKRALYYAHLAEEFYRAAATVQLPIKATLSYYGMLNLAKTYLSLEGVELESTWEHHGLTVPLGSKHEVQVQPPPSSGIGIFHELARLLGSPVTAAKKLSLKDICAHVPELHEIAFSLGLLPWTKRKFLPVRIDFCVNAAKNRMFTQLRYKKENEQRVATSQFHRGARKTYFNKLNDNQDWVAFRSVKRKSVNNDNWPRIYKNVRREYDEFNLVSILTREGYRYYCDLRPGDYHHLCYAILAVFYMGTVSRYRPTEAEEVLASELRPLIAEALATCPNQFLYQVVSRATASVCVIPYAALR